MLKTVLLTMCLGLPLAAAAAKLYADPARAALVEKRFVVVHVNVGERGIETNFDVAQRYGIPLRKGVPALAVLDGSGHLVYAQTAGEFENMRAMDPASVHDFLVRWEGTR
jgi:hypothetical protein